MNELARLPKGWVQFTAGVLVVAVLYWAQPVIVPVVVAVLLTFVLTPVVFTLQRVLGRVLAVLVVVALTFSALGLAGWAVTQQVTSIVQQLPSYRTNIRHKIRDIKDVGKGGSVATIKDTVADIAHEITAEPQGTKAAPLVVRSSEVAGLWAFPTAIGSWLAPFATAGLVVVLVVFMLLERQELRNRVIKLFGYGTLAVTTRAFDEAGSRVSRYLFRQSLLNVIYGTAAGVALWLIGVPYAVLWGFLSAVLRYVPLIGPWIAAGCAFLVSLAVFDGWLRSLSVGVVFIVLELLTNMVLEPLFYAGAAGISQVGLMVAIAFWTWLWGPVGLLVATPLTVCLVVLGKHVPGLEFLSILMADDAQIESDVTYYQRLLAGDQDEAAEILDQHLASGEDADGVFDAIMLPALNYAERDRIEGRLTVEEESALIRTTARLLAEQAEARGRGDTAALGVASITVLGCPIDGEGDAVALEMLAQILDPALRLRVVASPMMSSDIIALVREEGHRAICIADLPPGPATKSRSLVKRLRAALPEVRIIVGRWCPQQLADETDATLAAAGATAVTASLCETRNLLAGWMPSLRQREPELALASPDRERSRIV